MQLVSWGCYNKGDPYFLSLLNDSKWSKGCTIWILTIELKFFDPVVGLGLGTYFC